MQAVLEAGPAVWGLGGPVLDAGPDREVVRRRFTVDYTLAGLDLLLHRIGWSVQVPRPATERDEAQAIAWKQQA